HGSVHAGRDDYIGGQNDDIVSSLSHLGYDGDIDGARNIGVAIGQDPDRQTSLDFFRAFVRSFHHSGIATARDHYPTVFGDPFSKLAGIRNSGFDLVARTNDCNDRLTRHSSIIKYSNGKALWNFAIITNMPRDDFQTDNNTI